MSIRKNATFITLSTEGALLPVDFLERLAAGAQGIDGLTPDSYGLAPGERTGDAIARSWARLTGVWAGFRKHLETLSNDDLATGPTRERWLLPLFSELGYGRLPVHKAVEIEGKSYPISHMSGQIPVHLVGCRIDIDRRQAGATGASRSSPHSMVQEFLNRSDDHLWAIVSNGLRLRILRDNVSFTRQAYIEFDLEAMMDGEVYSDFDLLWRVCHNTRLIGSATEPCWLERWSILAQQEGTRALDTLRAGVEKAITELGAGFIAHGLNPELKDSLHSGTLDKQEYYRQLLRVVYRLLFLFVAEDRDLLLSPDADETARERYNKWYSTNRLRSLARRTRTGGRHVDIGRMLFLIFSKLESGAPELGLSPLGGFLWSREAIGGLAGCEIRNESILAAIRALAWTEQNKVRMPVDFKNLGSEELGSVYESLLELHPVVEPRASHFELSTAAGNERKSTGSYYTPTCLITSLLDSALNPVLDEAAKQSDPVAAILSLKVCDPACGSGHFLVGAAHRIAKRLATVRTGEEEPDPATVRHALREVIGRCIYGADINPMSVELCKVSLWMEAMEPGRPLSFLDHHIQCGNSLIGATPRLLKEGIPDGAFSPIQGDDKTVCSSLKKLNTQEKKGLNTGLFAAEGSELQQKLSQLALTIESLPDDEVSQVNAKAELYRKFKESDEYRQRKLFADAWCAAFVIRKHTDPTTNDRVGITQRILNELAAGQKGNDAVLAEAQQLSEEYQFLHWHLAYPDVFRLPGSGEKPENEQTGWSGGFDCVLGNPPWETAELKEIEWFAEIRPDISAAANAAARRAKIMKLQDDDPALFQRYSMALRYSEGCRSLYRESGIFKLTAVGKLNTYSLFADLNRNLLSCCGRVGCIVPSGIATDDTTKYFFQDITDSGSLVSLYDFENREKIFPAVDSRMKFCLITMAGRGRPAGSAADFVFFALDTADLNDEARHFTLSANEIGLINPNTRTCPIFRGKQDAELTKAIYRRVPVLIREANEEKGSSEDNPWGLAFSQGLFNMATDSHLFRTTAQLEGEGYALTGNIYERNKDLGGESRYLPLYEAKMIHHYDHRWATYDPDGSTRDMTLEEKQDPNAVPMPRYWVSAREVYLQLARLPQALVTALKNNDAPATLCQLARLLLGCRLSAQAESGVRITRSVMEQEWEKYQREHSYAQEITLSELGLVVSSTRSKNAPDDAMRIEELLQAAKMYGKRLPEAGTLSDEQSALAYAESCLEATSPKWLMGWRDICRSTDERTVISAISSLAAAGDTYLLMFPSLHEQIHPILNAAFDSFVADYVTRQKIGGTHLKYHVFKQIAMLLPHAYEEISAKSIMARIVELIQTTNDLSFWSIAHGYDGPPFCWDEKRRFIVRCEIDAIFFHLYFPATPAGEWLLARKADGCPCDESEAELAELKRYFPTPRAAVAYIMDTFPIAKRKDEQEHGSYRTKDTILEIYDRMAAVQRQNHEAIAAGRTPDAKFVSQLNPPPGPPTDAEGNFIPYAKWTPEIRVAYKTIIHSDDSCFGQKRNMK